MLRTIFDIVDIIEAGTGNTALAYTDTRTDLDWIFVDYSLPDINGLSLLKAFKEQLVSAPVIFMSASEQIAMIAAALEFGASGFISKSAARSEYQQCLTTITQGGIYLAKALEQQVLHYQATYATEKRRVINQISKRQTEVLMLIAAGYSNAEIGRSLGISTYTVKDHVSSIMQLLNTDNRVHCIAEARELGLLN